MNSLGIICTPEEYARSFQDPLLHCLTRTETIGVIVSTSSRMPTFNKFLTFPKMKTEAAFLSLIAVLYVVALVLVRWCSYIYKSLNDAEFVLLAERHLEN